VTTKARTRKPKPETNGAAPPTGVHLDPQEAQVIAGLLANPQVSALCQTPALKMIVGQIQMKCGGG
jgi:hypothetical protein